MNFSWELCDDKACDASFCCCYFYRCIGKPHGGRRKAAEKYLIGAWTNVSDYGGWADAIPPRDEPIFGPRPQGILLLSADGQYSEIIVNPDHPKFKGDSRMAAPKGSRLTVEGTLTRFGAWSVGEESSSSGTILLRIVGSTLPDEVGTELHRKWGKPNGAPRDVSTRNGREWR